jgi:hypothetical protein
MKWNQKGHEFDEIAGIILKAAANNNFYIWGAGFYGDAIFTSLSPEINIIGYVDSDINKHSLKKNELTIFPTSVLKDVDRNSTTVLVSAGWTNDIFNSLSEMGFKKNIDFFHIDEFLSILMMYKYNKVCLANLNVGVKEKCTLRCEKCCQYTSYIKNPKNMSFIEFKKELENCFKTVDYISSFVLAGGDALCNPECCTMLEFIGENYLGSRIGTIEILSNAIILPNKNMLVLLQKYNVYFRFTNYGKHAPQKIDDLISILNVYKIRFDHVRYTYWYDNGYPQESNGLYDDAALQEYFNRCDRRSCHVISKGKFLYCSMAIGADRIGYCPILEDDYFDLNYPVVDKKIFIVFAHGFSNKCYLNYCRKCNGGINISTIKIPVGIQLK